MALPAVLFLVLLLTSVLAGCGRGQADTQTYSGTGKTGEPEETEEGEYTLTTKVTDVINDPAFEDYGRLIFPVDRSIDGGLELQDVGDILIWYNNVNPERTVEIVNYMKNQVTSGEQIFYDIYTDEEKEEDPEKEDTGLFFFRGEPGAKTAVVNAGGGFVYVAAMHDSFPQALELARRGVQCVCPDLPSRRGYSLWAAKPTIVTMKTCFKKMVADGCTFRGAIFTHSNFSGALIQSCRMEQTDWTNCCTDSTVFHQTPMGQAKMNHVSEDEQDWSQDSGPALSM